MLPQPRPRAGFAGKSDDLPAGLPPLDGDDEERELDAPALDDERAPKDDNDPFDDATGEGDPLENLPQDGAEGGWLTDADEASALDVGAADLVGSEDDDLLSDLDDADIPADDFDLSREESKIAVDGGEEGPSTDDETLDEEGLPRLDADDDGAMEDPSSFFDEDLEPERPGAWSTPWERFGAPLSVGPTRSLMRAPRGVLAAGRELVRIDLEGSVERIAARGLEGSEALGVHLMGRDLFVTTEAGALFSSRDDGATFSEVSAWRVHVRPEEAAAGVDVVVSEGAELWARTGQGSLLWSGDRGEQWELTAVDGFVRALGTDSMGRCLVLVCALGASEILRRSQDGWERTALPADLLPTELLGRATVVGADGAVAIAIDGVGVFRALGDAAWSRIPGTELVTSIALLDETGTLVVATSGADSERHTSLLRVGADGEPKLVARLDDRADGDLGVTTIAVDPAHEVVWVGGAFGVAVFQPRLGGGNLATKAPAE